MTASVEGILSLGCDRNQDGHTDYKVTLLIKCTTTADGPDQVLNAAGMPAIGAPYQSSSLPTIQGNPITDSNVWAFRWPNCTVSIHQEKKGDPNQWYEADILFSTKPLERCLTALPASPILEPPLISGSFTKYTKEALTDQFGNPIVSSSWEIQHGQGVERDFNNPSVTITQNYSTFGGSLWAPMVDTVNMYTLWGCPPRTVKLSNVKWERKLYSVCTFFYRITYDFDLNLGLFGFDRLLPDEGTKYLAPGGNPFNPQHFIVNKDSSGEPCPCLLDGSGNVWTGIGAGAAITGLTVLFPPPGLVTITTGTAHGLSPGDAVVVRGAGGATLANGVWEIVSVPTANSLTYYINSSIPSLGAYTTGGQVGSYSDLTYPGALYVQFYSESNFLLLGIPSSL